MGRVILLFGITESQTELWFGFFFRFLLTMVFFEQKFLILQTDLLIASCQLTTS